MYMYVHVGDSPWHMTYNVHVSCLHMYRYVRPQGQTVTIRGCAAACRHTAFNTTCTLRKCQHHLFKCYMYMNMHIFCTCMHVQLYSQILFILICLQYMQCTWNIVSSSHTCTYMYGCLLDALFTKWTPCRICKTLAKVLEVKHLDTLFFKE